MIVQVVQESPQEKIRIGGQLSFKNQRNESKKFIK